MGNEHLDKLSKLQPIEELSPSRQKSKYSKDGEIVSPKLLDLQSIDSVIKQQTGNMFFTSDRTKLHNVPSTRSSVTNQFTQGFQLPTQGVWLNKPDHQIGKILHQINKPGAKES